MEHYDLKKWMQNGELARKEVLACNEYTKKFGVTLSEEETNILLSDRKDSLQQEGRIEFGEGILPKLIYAFCDSPYIY